MTYDLLCEGNCGTVLGTSTVENLDGHLCETCADLRYDSENKKLEKQRERHAEVRNILVKHFDGVLNEEEVSRLADAMGLVK